MTFKELGLIAPILTSADEAGYEEPSPIQAKAIPPVLAGRDLLGCAQTGTGKTAAFAMPILQRLTEAPAPKGKRPIRALILTPTRELALQIDESFAAYGKHLSLTPCVIFGGVNQNPQVTALKKGVDILTATPGRLNDLIGQGHIKLADVEIFVLDEADRMLDMGFVHDVKRVIAQLPPRRQTLLFSATMPREIEQLADSLLHDPAKVMVTPPATTVEKIDQSVCFVDKGNKRHLLAKLLRGPQVTSALVFTRTKHGADRVVRELGKDGITAKAIHGNKSQNARQDALGQFKDGTIRVLVATDIAARGIDVSGLSHVFNYDLPNIPETYVHRIGRTGRAGQDGIAVSFCDISEKPFLADIEKLTRQSIPVMEHEWPMQVFEVPEKQTQPRGPRGQNARGQTRTQNAKAPAKDKQPAKAQREPARARSAETIAQSEGTNMEQNDQRATGVPGGTPAQEGAGDSAAKRRRRRGGRRHRKPDAPAQEGTQQAAGTAPAQTTTGQKQPEKPRFPAKNNGGSNKPQSGPNAQSSRKGTAPGTQSGRNEKRQAPQPAAKSVAQDTRPAREDTARSDGSSGFSLTGAPAKKPGKPIDLNEPDDSIQVISRKAPAQKFSSFEEYMKAHGTDEPGTSSGGNDE